VISASTVMRQTPRTAIIGVIAVS